jgi:hypothetical protein
VANDRIAVNPIRRLRGSVTVVESDAKSIVCAP